MVVAVDVLREKYIGLETADLIFRFDEIYYERVLCDIEHLPFAPGSFDAVFSTASIHHPLDLRQAFEQVWRVLQPNGVLAAPGQRAGAPGQPADRSQHEF